MSGTREVTAAQLVAEHAAGLGPARAIGHDRRPLLVCGTMVGTVGADPSRVTPLCATSAKDLPVAEILAALSSQRPTGILVLESADGTRGFAFEVDQGRVTGARGHDRLDRLEAWLTEVYRRSPDRASEVVAPDGAAGWVGLAREFVQERVLEHLAVAREAGARMTFVRGDVEWMGARIPPEYGMGLDHLLLEHARREDEMPKLEAFLGQLDRVAVQLSEPGPTPTREGAGGTGLDFFDEPDSAAMSEWRDAVRLWRLCDGQSTLQELVDASLLGTFRSLAALVMLMRCRHIDIVLPEPSTVPRDPPLWEMPEISVSDEPADVIPLVAIDEPVAAPIDRMEPEPAPPPPAPAPVPVGRRARDIDTQYVYVRPKKPQVERIGPPRGTTITAPGAEPRSAGRRTSSRRRPGSGRGSSDGGASR